MTPEPKWTGDHEACDRVIARLRSVLIVAREALYRSGPDVDEAARIIDKALASGSVGVLLIPEELDFTDEGTEKFTAELIREMCKPIDPAAPPSGCFLT